MVLVFLSILEKDLRYLFRNLTEMLSNTSTKMWYRDDDHLARIHNCNACGLFFVCLGILFCFGIIWFWFCSLVLFGLGVLWFCWFGWFGFHFVLVSFGLFVYLYYSQFLQIV